MTMFPNLTGVSRYWGYVKDVTGPSVGDPNDISYTFSTLGIDGPELVFTDEFPTTRSAEGVEVHALPVGTPVVIDKDVEGCVTFWPLGHEMIVFEDCEPTPGETIGNRVLSFFKRIVGAS